MSLETCAGCSTRYAVGLAACPNCRSAERADGPAVEVPLWADTACTNTACPAAGVQRRVMLPRPTVGVVELPTLLCARCGHVLPLAWPGPSTEDSVSPKITRHGGPTNKRDPESAAAAEPEPTPAVAADQTEIVSAADAMAEAGAETAAELADGLPEPEGGESSSPGSSSSTSTGKPSATPSTSKAAPRKRTPRASRSTPDQTESSSPSSPDTSGPETGAPTDGEPEA